MRSPCILCVILCVGCTYDFGQLAGTGSPDAGGPYLVKDGGPEVNHDAPAGGNDARVDASGPGDAPTQPSGSGGSPEPRDAGTGDQGDQADVPGSGGASGGAGASLGSSGGSANTGGRTDATGGSGTAGTAGTGGAAGRTGTGGDAGGSGAAGTSGGAGHGGAAGGTACIPAGEICDGLDDNCDGRIDESPACPAGCTGFAIAGHGYMYCSTLGDATAAKLRCTQQSMHLAWIESAVEDAALGVAVVAAAHRPYNGGNQAGPIIGGTDAVKEGTFVWGSGTTFWTGGLKGSPAGNAYTNWAHDEPNNNGTPSENCMEFLLENGDIGLLGQWNDVPCDRAIYETLCEQF
jgi:hypothetical protein